MPKELHYLLAYVFFGDFEPLCYFIVALMKNLLYLDSTTIALDWSQFCHPRSHFLPWLVYHTLSHHNHTLLSRSRSLEVGYQTSGLLNHRYKLPSSRWLRDRHQCLVKFMSRIWISGHCKLNYFWPFDKKTEEKVCMFACWSSVVNGEISQLPYLESI